ncbi:anthranilate synthase component I [Corticicoccus populi]|uniref:Anthranilate synthase component 1 n=1 Tax=Corticicoccus populi TaxID=1812821 RepID=A0ABW5WUN1_9STAP
MSTFKKFQERAETYKTVPVVDTFFTDILTPIHIFNALKDEASYILESNDPTSEWSNYSFIGLNPMYEMKEIDHSFTVTDTRSDTSVSYSSLSEAFSETMQQIDAFTDDIPLPFKGGAVGYISYEAVSDFAPVEPRSSAGGKYHFIFCSTLIAYNHRTKETSVISYADTSSDTPLQEVYETHSNHINDVKEKLQYAVSLRDLMLSPDAGENQPIDVSSNYTHDAFIRDVKKIKDYIYQGDVFQAVLSQRFEVETTCSGFELYRILRNINPSPYMFYLTLDDKTLIGSSPERQLEVNNGRLEIHPIAGTRPRGATPEEDEAFAADLINDEKELAEHRMLVDLARNDIGRVAEYGSVDVTRYMTIGRFAKVMHIVSVVNGQIRDNVTPIDAFVSAFPAGTLSGAPKVRAMQILREFEPTARGVYGGAVLYVGFDGNMDSCITIRTMTLSGSTIHIQAGAGVVADSEPEAEFQETVNKASALIKTVQIAESVFGKAGESNDTDD